MSRRAPVVDERSHLLGVTVYGAIAQKAIGLRRGTAVVKFYIFTENLLMPCPYILCAIDMISSTVP